MYYGRKLTDVEFHAEIVVEQHRGTDLDKKRFGLGQKYGIGMAEEDHKLRVVGGMTLKPFLKYPKMWM
ncbi:MAG: hypothetical protein WAN47_00900 [Nitrosotalea sp.]